MAYDGPGLDDPDSYTSKRLARRKSRELVGRARERRDLFVAALVMGHNRTDAAMLAGVPRTSAQVRGSQMFTEPYVQEKFRALRDAVDVADIVNQKDILIGLLTEARDVSCPNGTQAARVSAWNSIARILGVEKPQKIDVNMNGGVMLVPMTADASDWETLANDQQRVLREAVRD